MSERIRVNVRSLANTAAVRREKRNGCDVVIVPSATLPDDVVMNGIQYPADEIEKSYKTLDRTPAPAGHPLVNGQFVSALDPEGINIGWIGAWNENVRRENGRVFLDKVIDVQRASQTEAGKAVLNAIDKGDPVHTSTGLYCLTEAANGDVDYDYIARDIEFDHDAILLNEEGAATPEQGVGMMVNSAGEAEEIKVINSALDMAEQEIDWAGQHLLRALEQRERASLWERIKSAIMEAVGESGRETSANNRKDADMADNSQLEDLSAKVNALTESAVTKDDLAEALKPLTDGFAEMKANQEAEATAKHDELVNKVVGAKIEGMTEEVCKKMDTAALNAVLNMHKAQNTKAAPLAPGFVNSNSDDSMSPLAGVTKQ